MYEALYRETKNQEHATGEDTVSKLQHLTASLVPQVLQHGGSLSPQVLVPVPVEPLGRAHLGSKEVGIRLVRKPTKIFANESPSPVNNLTATFHLQALSVWQPVGYHFGVDRILPHPLAPDFNPLLAVAH
jgi:hypothetical protein